MVVLAEQNGSTKKDGSILHEDDIRELAHKIKNSDIINAIQRGVRRNDKIADLEPVGLNSRLINILEDKRILSIGDLLSCTPEDLLTIDSVGIKTLYTIMECLSKYDKVEEHKILASMTLSQRRKHLNASNS